MNIWGLVELQNSQNNKEISNEIQVVNYRHYLKMSSFIWKAFSQRQACLITSCTRGREHTAIEPIT